ncbi:MAG: wax ester/triacylglycerol synthase family O-acyltransferase [Polaromonas sp.]
MKPLTGLDASFLYLETPEMPMHVGSFNLCELPPGFKGSFHRAVQDHLAKRIHLAPVFSRKLVAMPLNLGHPAWVEAESVDIGFHVRRADPAKKGAAPMTLAEAHLLVARLHSELLDRAYPLWEFYVFDRIQLPESQGGTLVAGVLSKIHHAALDGKGGVMLANALLDLSPVPREVPPPDSRRRQRVQADNPGSADMLGSVFSSSLGQFARLIRALPSAVRTIGATLARQSVTSSADGPRGRMPMKLAPHTPFNIGIGTERVFAAATLPLAQCKALGKTVGGSLNDVVLWVCATALREYLLKHHSLPPKSLVASMPVSLRAEPAADAGAQDLGNQVSMSLVELGTQIAHPLKRMNAILASTAKVKSSMQSLKSLLPTDYPSLLAPWLVGGLARQVLNAYGKSGLAGYLPTVTNLAISNVPGSRVPLYLAGARYLSFHPLSIIVHGVALNITVQTYVDQIDFGIVADPKALPHAEELATAIEAAFRQAQALMGSADASQTETTPPEPAKKPARKSAGPTQKAVNKSTGVKTPVNTRKTAVPQATNGEKLESSHSGKPRRRPDTAVTPRRSKPPTPPVSSHGKTVDQAPAKSARRKPAAGNT